jgi:hypothetical protein
MQNGATKKCNFKSVLFSGDAILEYSCLSFNTEQQLIGLTGVPDFKLTLWDWTKKVKLHSINTSVKVCAPRIFRVVAKQLLSFCNTMGHSGGLAGGRRGSYDSRTPVCPLVRKDVLNTMPSEQVF